MRFLLTAARKDLLRLARDPMSLLVWMGIPVFTGLLLLVVFGGRPATPHGLLLVADEDGTLISGVVSTAFAQGELGKMFLVEKVEQAAGRRRMARGEASALLVVPKGFSEAVLRNQRCQLKVVTNPSQRILPRIVEEVASVLADSAFYVNAIAGDQLRVFAVPPPGGVWTYPDATIAGVSTAFNRLAESLRKYINPPVIKLETGVRKDATPEGPDIPKLFFPSMLSMTVLFFAQGLSGDIWKERNHHTLRRIASTAAPLWQFLAGKLIALASALALAGAAGLACARWLLGLPVPNPVLAALWVVASGAALYLFLTLLQMLAASARAANLLVNFCFFPLAMLGGIFFPFEMMPAGMAALARRLPMAWALMELRSLLADPAQAAHAAFAFAVLGAVCTLLFLLALARLKRGFAE
jgi:ABC-2 type transport system permease protein